jgi:hypothetical protein
MARQFVKHQVGMCLSYDTEVTFVKKVNGYSNGTYTKSLQYIADMWFGKIKYQGGNKGKMNVSGSHIRVFNEDTQRFEESKIVDVIDSGIKSVYEIRDNFGNTIKATKDHKFLTDCGWQPLEALTIGSLLIRTDQGESFGYKPKRCNNSEDVICRREFRKTFMEVDKCDNCETYTQKSNLVADHKVAVSVGGTHSLDNLQKLCGECNEVKSTDERKAYSNTNLLPKYVEITSITYVGDEQCYDISVDRIHNFIGNGFVVHNCWNEESRRYISDEPEFYIPEVFRGKPVNAKQGSSEDVVSWIDYGFEGETPYELVHRSIYNALNDYEQLLQSGVAPEQARMVLPQNVMTNWMWTGSLVAFARVCKLRLDSHAQKEAQELAKLIHDVIAPLYPVSWKALMNNNN